MKFVATRVGYQLVIDQNQDGTPERVLTSTPVLVSDADATVYQGVAAAAGVALLVAQAPDSPPGPPDRHLIVATLADLDALGAGGGGGGTSVGVDTDGTPYFDPAGVTGGTTVLADADGVPYFV